MTSPAESIRTYIRAKDENRPHLLARAFVASATVEMDVRTAAISFPPSASGIEAIGDMLVRQFGQIYENVYTFCLAPPPAQECRRFSCDWLVGMSNKEGKAGRVGCGRYDWIFASDGSGLVEKLVISIDTMEVVDASEVGPVLDWLAGLPYPWCAPDVALKGAPGLRAIEVIVDRVRAGAAP